MAMKGGGEDALLMLAHHGGGEDAAKRDPRTHSNCRLCNGKRRTLTVGRRKAPWEK